MKIGHTIDSNGFWTGDVLEDYEITPQVTVICPDGFNLPRWDGDSWIEGKVFDLAQYKQDKIDLLSATCKSEILKNFTSNALGVVHSYGFDADDQTNLGGNLGAINAGLCPASFDWRTKDTGSLPHTIAQFKVLFTDGMTHKQTNIYKYWTLKSQVEACTDKSSIDVIVW